MTDAARTDELLLASQRVAPARPPALGHRFSDPDIDGPLARPPTATA